MAALIDYAQHGIKLAQLLRQFDDHCLRGNLPQAHEVSLDIITESRLLSLSVIQMMEQQQANELKRKA